MPVLTASVLVITNPFLIILELIPPKPSAQDSVDQEIRLGLHTLRYTQESADYSHRAALLFTCCTSLPLAAIGCHWLPLGTFGRLRAIVTTSAAFNSLFVPREEVMCPPMTTSGLKNILHLLSGFLSNQCFSFIV